MKNYRKSNFKYSIILSREVYSEAKYVEEWWFEFILLFREVLLMSWDELRSFI